MSVRGKWLRDTPCVVVTQKGGETRAGLSLKDKRSFNVRKCLYDDDFGGRSSVLRNSVSALWAGGWAGKNEYSVWIITMSRDFVALASQLREPSGKAMKGATIMTALRGIWDK